MQRAVLGIRDRGYSCIPSDLLQALPQDWPRQWKARLKRSPSDLSLVTGLFSCLLRYCRAPGGGLCA